MAESGIWFVVALLITVVIIFGGSSIITTFQKAPPVIKQIIDETNVRCDLCLEQFSDEIKCTHDTQSKPCTAVRNFYCTANCTIELR